MLHKAMSHSNSKFLSLFVTAAKCQSNYPCILRSKTNLNCLQAKPADIHHLRTYAYPTHLLIARGYSDGTEGKQKAKPFVGLNLTTFYSAKFWYAYFCDKSVRYHVGRSFFTGAIEACLYVSKCLHEKDYNGLSEVVTPELFERIQKQDKIRSEKTEPGVFLAKDLKFVSFANINWKMDRKTKIKTLEVLVRFAFFNKEVEFPKSFQGWAQSVTTGTVDGSALNFAHFKFYRTYGEEMKDSPWIIKDLYYFTAPEKFLVSVK